MTDSPGGRRRGWTVIQAFAGTAAARAITVGAGFALVPWLVEALGPGGYGKWAAFSAALAIAPLLDLGLSASILTRLSQAVGRSASEEQRRIVATSFFLSCAISLVMVALVAGLVVPTRHLLWDRLGSDLRPAALTAFIVVVATLPFSLTPRILLALQKGRQAGGVLLTGAITGAVGSILALWLGGGITGLAMAWCAGWIATHVGGAIALWTWHRPDLWPHLGDFDRDISRRAWRDMFYYSLLQGVGWLFIAVDPLLVALFRDEADAGVYAVTQQLMMLPGQVVVLVVQPLWSAFGEAWGQGDVAFIRRTLKRYLVLAIITAGAGTLVLAMAAPWFDHTWAKGRLSVDPVFLTGIGLTGIVTAIGSVLAALLNALGFLREQVLLAGLLILATLGGKLVLLPIVGMVAMPWAAAVSYAVCILLPWAIMLPRRLQAKVV